MAALHLGEFAEGLVKSGTMILISEIGDKTFFIAAIMAMRNPRGVVFAGAPRSTSSSRSASWTGSGSPRARARAERG